MPLTVPQQNLLNTMAKASSALMVACEQIYAVGDTLSQSPTTKSYGQVDFTDPSVPGPYQTLTPTVVLNVVQAIADLKQFMQSTQSGLPGPPQATFQTLAETQG